MTGSPSSHRDPPSKPDPAAPPPESGLARRLDRAARGRWALPALFAGSVVESTLFPWPIEFPLLAQMLRGRAYVFPAALAVILGSITGCFIAFGVGALAFEAAQALLAERPGAAEAVEATRARVDAAGAWAVFIGMMTPVPVQITSFAAGLSGVPLVWFAIAVATGRSIRYLSMAVLVYFFGERIMGWWRKRNPWVKWGFIAAFILAFLAALVLALRG